MSQFHLWIVLLIFAGHLSGQSLRSISFHDHMQKSKQQIELRKLSLKLSIISQFPEGVQDGSPEPQTPLLHELGYIAAMQVAFGGLSYLASRESGYGPLVASGFDVFMGVAGLLNGSNQELTMVKIGYFALSAGFFAKSYYTMRGSENHSAQTKFWTNYVGYNVLVFSGYFLDSL